MSDEMDEREERDETIERVAALLRPLPTVDSAAKARVLVAVAAERERDRERDRANRGRRRLLRWTGGAALAAAGVFSAFLIGQDRGAASATSTLAQSSQSTPTVTAAPVVGATAALAARDADRSALVPVQLVFHAPSASRVSVVGDFTGWEPTAAMTRDPASGLWSVSLAVPAGRHVYAFLIDDSVLVRDPRAAAAPDADFGRPGSVLLVGRP
jgi:hypothetical protein